MAMTGDLWAVTPEPGDADAQDYCPYVEVLRVNDDEDTVDVAWLADLRGLPVRCWIDDRGKVHRPRLWEWYVLTTARTAGIPRAALSRRLGIHDEDAHRFLRGRRYVYGGADVLIRSNPGLHTAGALARMERGLSSAPKDLLAFLRGQHGALSRRLPSVAEVCHGRNGGRPNPRLASIVATLPSFVPVNMLGEGVCVWCGMTRSLAYAFDGVWMGAECHARYAAYRRMVLYLRTLLRCREPSVKHLDHLDRLIHNVRRTITKK